MKNSQNKLAWIKWEYEDQLPSLTNEEYNAMFKRSRLSEKIIGVRIFPYIEQNNKRLYLA